MGTKKSLDGRSVEMYEFSMNIMENRLATFKSWPFKENCQCTPQNMAVAGFYHCPTEGEPDLAKCFVCFKELDGWEPKDDPWEEHKSHSPKCPFLAVKDFKKMSVSGYLKLEATRQANQCQKEIDRFVAEFDHQSAAARKQLVQCPWKWNSGVPDSS